MKGNRIKELRKSAGYTQSELGEKLGVVKQTISSWENDVSEPNSDMLVRLCNILGTTPEYLLGSLKTNDIIRISSVSNTLLKRYVYDSGYDTSELSKILNIEEHQLISYIEDYNDIPYDILSSLSDILGVSTDCLLGISQVNREKNWDNSIPFKYNTEISNRIKELCQQKEIDITSADFTSLLSLSDKEAFYMIEYGFIPHMEVLIKLADYFDVSVDYLLCRSDRDTLKATQAFSQLNEDNKDIIIGEIKKCLREQKFNSVAAEKQLKEAK